MSVIDNRQPLYSHLLLTKTEGDVKNYGLLEAREIMNMNLRADLCAFRLRNRERQSQSWRRRSSNVLGFLWPPVRARCYSANGRSTRLVHLS
jgi:hypothetical protein